MKTALSIAGSDSCGGAGIQADLKTMTMNGVYAMTAITALTAQNTIGIRDICEVTPEFLSSQLEAIFEDIYPDSVKVGMVSSTKLIEIIALQLKKFKAKNIVLDPVMISTSGSRLIDEDAVEALKSQLIPIADVITPNIPEGEILAKMKINNRQDMIIAAKKISKESGCAVLLKGGHNLNNSSDLLFENNHLKWFEGKKISNPNTHGTGCTLSSAIAANLANGYTLENSIKRAKEYITGAIQSQLDLGKGSGPIDHAYILK